jgi:Zn-dependent protease/CBS domain-containing protein
MSATFRLGRIAGVPVGVNWSVLVIFALIAWGLAAERFPATYPDRPAAAYAAAGVGAAVAFFAGLLAHEVAHAVVARRNGLAVDSITLWLFGGVARLGGQAPDPGAELRIAGIGPLVSLAVGVVFGGVAAAVGLLSGTGLAFGALAWLAGINVALAAFNVIPAAPLDGGRLLRAGLWRWRGDRTWAAVIAARAGRLFGAILIAVGLCEIFVSRIGFGGIWLVVLGWFLIGAASAEERQAQVGEMLSGVQVRDVMTPQPYAAPADISVAEFLDGYLFRHRFSSFPLVRDAQPVGLVTLSRIKQVSADDRAQVLLQEVACPMREVPTGRPDEGLTDLLGRLDGCTDGRALVLSDGQLVGIVSPSDVNRALQHAGLIGAASRAPMGRGPTG